MNLAIPLILYPVVVIKMITTVTETIVAMAAAKIKSATKLYFNYIIRVLPTMNYRSNVMGAVIGAQGLRMMK